MKSPNKDVPVGDSCQLIYICSGVWLDVAVSLSCTKDGVLQVDYWEAFAIDCVP